jgi:hypothetical protein
MFLATTLVGIANDFALRAAGIPPPIPRRLNVTALESAGNLFDHLLSSITNSIFNPMFFLMLLFLLRLIVRKQWIATVIFVGFASFLVGNETGHGSIGYVYGFLWGAIAVIVLIRFGFVAFTTGFFLNYLCSGFPLTLDSSDWYFGPSAVALAVAAGLMLFGFTTALAGRSLVRDDL